MESAFGESAVRIYDFEVTGRMRQMGINQQLFGREEFSPAPLRSGCAATLYASGADPADIRRLGRWGDSIYMRYIWCDNVLLQHPVMHLGKHTTLSRNLRAPQKGNRKVQLNTEGGLRNCGSIRTATPSSYDEQKVRDQNDVVGRFSEIRDPLILEKESVESGKTVCGGIGDHYCVQSTRFKK